MTNAAFAHPQRRAFCACAPHAVISNKKDSTMSAASFDKQNESAQAAGEPDLVRRLIVAGIVGSFALSACGGGGGGSSDPGSSTPPNPAIGQIPPDRANLPRPALPNPAS